MSWQAQAWVWTLNLSPIEKLVALALANSAHANGENIRPGMVRVERETGANPKTVQRARDALLKAGHLVLETKGGGRGNPDIYSMPVDMDRVASFHKRVPARDPLLSLKGPSVSAKGSLISVPSDGSSLLSTIEPKVQPTRTREDVEAEFEKFWAAYPKREDKGHARKAFAAAISKAAPEVIMEGLKRCQFSPDPKFRPHPATWLNGERWADEATVPPPERKNGFDPDWGRMF